MTHLSEEQLRQFRADSEAFLSFVEGAVRAAAPDGSTVQSWFGAAQEGALESRHHWRIDLGGDGGCIELDFQIVVATAPPCVFVLHGNRDAGALGGLAPWQGTLIDLNHMSIFGLQQCLERAFQQPPNETGYS